MTWFEGKLQIHRSPRKRVKPRPHPMSAEALLTHSEMEAFRQRVPSDDEPQSEPEPEKKGWFQRVKALVGVE